MSNNVVQFPGLTRVEIPVEELLEKAADWEMTRCIVIGVKEDGEMCFGGSFSDVPLINLFLDRAKFLVLEDEEFDGRRVQD